MTDVLARIQESLSGRYAIEREIGQGGMATVFLAQDVRHHRKVALKLLRPELAAILGGERFLHEIRTTANLQHPHILSLFDSGEADGLIYYVMPFVDGESLRQRLTREKQLPVEVALRIAREVADALAYAHAHGIIHRDIKPENILLQGGHALVADFGIALAASRSDSGTRMTETGMSLGTPHYMSPEQAMGEKEITPRADIYALGCVTYEMLAGEPPFNGPTAQAIIARVMTEQPRSLSLQRHTVPPNVDAAIRTALEKLPADRFDGAAQFAEALGNPAYATTGTMPTAVTGAAAPARSQAAATGRAESLPRWALPAAAAVALGIAGLLVGRALARPAAIPAPAMRFQLALPDSAQYVDTFGPGVAVSPDGSLIVYTGGTTARRQLFVRRVDDVHPIALAGTEGAYLPFFSPDGQWVGFIAGQRLMKVRVGGGVPVTITPLLGNFVSGASWSSKDDIVLEDVIGLSRVRASGGRLEILTHVDSVNTIHQWPSFLPDGNFALLSVRHPGSDDLLALVNLADGKVTPFDSVAGRDPRYLAPGMVVYLTPEDGLVAAPFDARSRRFTGPPVAILERVATDAGSAKMGVGAGLLVQVEGSQQRSRLLRVDRSGAVRPEQAEEAPYESPRLSPDGRRIAVSVASGGTTSDVWIIDRVRKTRQRITFADAQGRAGARPEWTADGRRLAFGYLARASWDIYTAAADGSGRPESLLATPSTEAPASWTPSGDTLVFWRQTAETRGDILYVGRTGGEHPFAVTEASESEPTLSPDGHWLAYVSDESGRREVFVRPFPAGPGKWQISQEGGIEPRWSRHGREIVFRSGEVFLAVPVETRPAFVAGRVDTLFRGPYEFSSIRTTYDISQDGNELIMVGASGSSRSLTAVLNPLAPLRSGRTGASNR